MRKLLLLSIVLLFISNGYTQIRITQNEKKGANVTNQSNTLEFTEFKVIDPQTIVVYFCITDIKNETQKQKILNDLQALNFIEKVRIYKDLDNLDRCQAEIPIDTNPKGIRDILIQNNTDFEFIFVKIKK